MSMYPLLYNVMLVSQIRVKLPNLFFLNSHLANLVNAKCSHGASRCINCAYNLIKVFEIWIWE